MRAWVLAPLDGKTNIGIKIIPGVKYTLRLGVTNCQAFRALIDLLPSVSDTTQVWSIDLDDEHITYLEKYDLISVIHDVSALVVENFAELETNEGFTRADAISDYVCGVRSMEGVINNAVYGFVTKYGRSAYDNKRAKYNRWLEHAVKTSKPNSLVA